MLKRSILAISVCLFFYGCGHMEPSAPGYGKHDTRSSDTWLVSAHFGQFFLNYTRTGNKISGFMRGYGNINEQRPIKGTITGNKISFKCYEYKIPEEYRGTISNDGNMIQGTFNHNGNWGYKWSAKNINNNY